ncbi:MAG TPA: hypothetical protein VFK97_03055, partial [Candidatus Saccharimonadales bacterium]|nr:hypothetical protein [Candidatus Saccharimonadales bacterium]
MKYQAELHTPEALATQIAAIYSRAPDTILLGSLGRAVIFDRLLSNPNAEFEVRGQVPEHKLEDGEVIARDIDFIGRNARLLDPQNPFVVDFAFDNRQISFRREGEDWFLVSERMEVYEPLHP